MSLIEAIVLAIVEGVTEFLPISSTGHLIIVSTWMGIQHNDFTKMFTVSIQLGAILSVVVLYWKRFFSSVVIYKKLFVAFIPAVVLGLLLGGLIDQLLENVMVVAIALILGGVFLLIVDRLFRHNNQAEPTYRNALIIGICQCMALIPGVSRSAATIIGGLTQKLSKKAAAEFSFLLAVPTMFAATCYQGYKHYKLFSDTSYQELLLVGNVVAFLVALLSIRFFIGLIQKGVFKWFGYYRIAMGLFILVLLALGIRLHIPS
jgi:undecaprenyl-diphosphatase